MQCFRRQDVSQALLQGTASCPSAVEWGSAAGGKTHTVLLKHFKTFLLDLYLEPSSFGGYRRDSTQGSPSASEHYKPRDAGKATQGRPAGMQFSCLLPLSALAQQQQGPHTPFSSQQAPESCSFIIYRENSLWAPGRVSSRAMRTFQYCDAEVCKQTEKGFMVT